MDRTGGSTRSSTELVVTEPVGSLSPEEVKKIVAIVLEHLRQEQRRLGPAPARHGDQRSGLPVGRGVKHGTRKTRPSRRRDGASIYALFNPEKYTVSRSVQYAEIAIPGLDAPVVQFIRGQSEKVTLELFFDTTDRRDHRSRHGCPHVDVAGLRLMSVRSDTHAPPRLIVFWGDGGRLLQLRWDRIAVVRHRERQPGVHALQPRGRARCGPS